MFFLYEYSWHFLNDSECYRGACFYLLTCHFEIVSLPKSFNQFCLLHNYNPCISAALIVMIHMSSLDVAKIYIKVFFPSSFPEHSPALCDCSVNTDNQTLFYF